MILATYSGSLVALGSGSSRKFQYASIKIRSDVPDILNGEKARLTGELKVGTKASFTDAPVKHTSAIYRIAATPADITAEEQDSRVREAMVFLTTSFIHINRQLTYPGESGPGQFDKKSMVKYLADNNDVSPENCQGHPRRLRHPAGIRNADGKNRCPWVQLGRLSLSLKPVRKARVGRNPATGEEITIPAKPAHMAPVFKFSSRSKERADNIPGVAGRRIRLLSAYESLETRYSQNQAFRRRVRQEPQR